MRKLMAILALVVLFGTQLFAQNRTVTGKVTDDKGTPLVGVTVSTNSSNKRTLTDNGGNFSLQATTADRSLRFSYVGFVNQTVTIGSGAMSVSLAAEDKSLSEVVVVGYGTQRKKDVTASVATVKGEAVANKPVQSFEQALGGRAAGVQVSIPNGVLNNPPVIRVRGTNSISLSSYPLIVIDGVPSFTGDQSSVNAAANPLASINPNDIESIDIAKDAAASAIYGSRAANGVVFVTTKRGKLGRTRVTYDGNVSWAKAQRLPVLLNAQQYTDIKNEGLVNLGTFNAATNAFALTTGPDGNPINTNWYDYAYRTGMSHNHTVSVSGANESTSYYFSFGYSDQEGIIRRNNFNRKTVLANIDSRINKVITVGGKLSFTQQMNEAALSSGSLAGEAFNTGGLGRLAQVSAPNVSPYNNDGSYNTNPTTGLLGSMNNKQAQVGFYNFVAAMDLNRSNAETQQFQGNVFLQVKPFNWMTLRTVYGLDYQSIDNDVFSSPLSGEGFPIGSATGAFNKNRRWVWTNTAQFDYTLADKHVFSLLAGTEQQKSEASGYGVNRTTVSDPFFNNLQGGFGTVALANTSGNIGENYLSSIFGRLTYAFDRKYSIAGNVRRDGASQLGANNKYGTFWGISAGWEIARENFWSAAKLDNVFSSFKLRGSYGRLGNIAGLGNYGTLSTYGAGLYGTSPTLVFSNAGNPDLKWETSTKTDIGLNWGILGDKITGEIAYYRNDVDGLILNVTQPPSAGLPNAIATNVGKMYNTGLEFSVNVNAINKKDFSWNSSFNISYNKNQVTELAPTLPTLVSATAGLESVNITLPGYPIGTLYVTRTGGVDPTTGRRIFITAAGNPIQYRHEIAASRWVNAAGTSVGAAGAQDAVAYQNTNPKYYGGWENTFRFKNFELSALFTYQLDFYMYYGSRAGLHDQRFWNNEADILQRWTKAGDNNAPFPKVIFGDNVSNGSSFPLDIQVFKGDFVKLRTLTLSYSVPKTLTDKIKINNARFYVSGNNLLIMTKYPGPDPEASSNGNGTTNQGVDRNQAPNARIFTFGLNVGF